MGDATGTVYHSCGIYGLPAAPCYLQLSEVTPMKSQAGATGFGALGPRATSPKMISRSFSEESTGSSRVSLLPNDPQAAI